MALGDKLKEYRTKKNLTLQRSQIRLVPPKRISGNWRRDTPAIPPSN